MEKSTVDYCLVSPNLYNKVISFRVGNLNPVLSDHCPIEVIIMTNFSAQTTQDNYNYLEIPKKIQWNSDIACKFENIIQSKHSKFLLNNFLQDDIQSNQYSIDSATSFISDLLVNCAEKASQSDCRLQFKGSLKKICTKLEI